MFNSKLKQSPLRAKILGDLPPFLISSQSVKLRKTLWAAPMNSAEMATWRTASAAVDNNADFDISVPEMVEQYLKQVLVPSEEFGYLNVTPIPSAGLVNELYNRFTEQRIRPTRWTIQPSPVAMSNHGEALLMQAGAVSLFARGLHDVTKPENALAMNVSCVQLTAECQGMNIAAGMIAAGWPAITALGGMVHALERDTGLKLEFAFGMTSAASWLKGVPKFAQMKSSAGMGIGRASGKTTITPGFNAEEMKATCDIVVLVRPHGESTQDQLDKIYSALKKINRIAGGMLFETEIKILSDERPTMASYMTDASDSLSAHITSERDSLDSALTHYKYRNVKKSDIKKTPGLYIKNRGFTVNSNGFAFLSEPSESRCSRGPYPHVWAENTYCLTQQQQLSGESWWRRKDTPEAVYWLGSKNKALMPA
tara:strand:- start:603 stop:1877 length:1275 start_codon:yes stop_codon:yes gene_type:complete